MDLNINTLINEHGQEIANQLKIATEQVYDKVMWYIRIDGLVNLGKLFFYVIFALIWTLLLRGWLKSDDIDNETKVFGAFMIFGLVGLLVFMLWTVAIDYLVVTISMIASPEYYLIKQIVENIGK